MKKRLVVGNWKMYIEGTKEAKALAAALRRKARKFTKAEVWVAPSFALIPPVVDVLSSSPIRVGAQSVSAYDDAPHTGDVSGTMLKDAGVWFVIVGHSERRAAGESNTLVHAELEQATNAGLVPILCVGEREREQDGEHFEFIEAQLVSALRGLEPAALKKLVVAYEPVWAIGRGAEFAMKSAEVEEMVIFIRKLLADLLGRKAALKVPILYGGSVEPSNAATLLAEGGASGFLVGHASVSAESFLEIINACK